MAKLCRGGKGQRAQTGVGQHIDGDDGQAAAQLHGRGLKASDIGDLLREDDHQGIHDGAHAAQHQAHRRDARAQALAHDQKGAQQNSGKAHELNGGKAGLEKDRRDGHDNHGPAIEEKRGHAHANVAVRLKEEKPRGAQGGSRKGQVKGLPGVGLGGQVLAVLGREEDQAGEKDRAQEDTGKHDEGTGQVDEVGDDSVGTKKHKGQQVLLGVFGHVAQPSFVVFSVG